MPKYYRFRATSPTRKPKRSKEKEKERQIEKSKLETEKDWIDLTVSCTPTQSWYMRRISWREGNTPFLIPPKQLAQNLYSSFCSLQLTDLSDRPIVIKFPHVRSQVVMRF